VAWLAEGHEIIEVVRSSIASADEMVDMDIIFSGARLAL